LTVILVATRLSPGCHAGRAKKRNFEKTSAYTATPAGAPQKYFASGGLGLYFSDHLDGKELPMQTDHEVLKKRILELNLEHRDLDDVIAKLAEKPGQDQLQLQRLKKKKLLVKDQISLLERQLTPDISA
jgi:hypothetical protein